MKKLLFYLYALMRISQFSCHLDLRIRKMVSSAHFDPNLVFSEIMFFFAIRIYCQSQCRKLIEFTTTLYRGDSNVNFRWSHKSTSDWDNIDLTLSM